MKKIIKNSNEILLFTKILSFIQNLKSILKVNSTLELNSTMDLNSTASFKRMIPLKLSTTLPLNSILKLFLAIFIFNATIDLTTAANNPAWKHLKLEGLSIKRNAPVKSSLHYVNPYDQDPEIAIFYIDESKMKDIDKNKETGEKINYGIDHVNIKWELDNQDAGYLTGEGAVRIFVPNSNTCFKFKVKATVTAMDDCQETLKPHTDSITLLSQPISTFKVGIKLNGGGLDTIVFEGDNLATVEKNLFGSLSTLTIPMSGRISTDKISKSKKIQPQNIIWKTVARSDDMDLADIEGKISFSPSLKFTGRYLMHGNRIGPQLPSGTFMEIITIPFSGVKQAAASLSINYINDLQITSWGGGIIGVAAINEIDEKIVELKCINPGEFDWSNKIDFSGLNIGPKTIRKSPGYIISGSYAVSSEIIVNDCSMVGEATMTLGFIGEQFRAQLGCKDVKYVK